MHSNKLSTLLFAAAAMLGVGITSAFAATSGYQYPDFWGTQAVRHVPNDPANGGTVGAYVTQSNQGTWLFPPNANQGANS